MTPQGRWHRDVTYIDVGSERTGIKDARVLAKHAIHSLSPDATDREMSLFVTQYVYHKLGRPRWFITKEMLELLKDVTIEGEDLSGIPIPYDSMFLCFERGCEIEGIPLRSIFVSSLRSELARNVIRGLPGDENKSELNDEIDSVMQYHRKYLVLSIDCGMLDGIPPYRYEEDSPYLGRGWLANRPLNATGIKCEYLPGYSDKEIKAQLKMINIVAAAFLYHNARPEWHAPLSLERSDRYHHPQPRENIHQLLLPSVKYIRENASHLNTPDYQVKPHYRGFVLRTLRAQRFYKDKQYPPEYWRTILVPPCAIHPELMEKNT